MRPLARKDGLVIRRLGDETIVYDARRHRAHCLNSTAALVFHHCDGTRTAGEIAALIEAGASSDAVEGALVRLADAGLLASERRPSRAGTSRREALQRVAMGAALLAPIVTSLVVPAPADAQSCVQEADCTALGEGPCYIGNPNQCMNHECKGPQMCGPI